MFRSRELDLAELQIIRDKPPYLFYKIHLSWLWVQDCDLDDCDLAYISAEK